MPKLLIVSRCSQPRGGADQIIADLCRQLPNRGWDLTLGLTKGRVYNLPETYREVHPGLPIKEIDGSLGTRSDRQKAINRLIDVQKPDLVLIMRVFDALTAASRSRYRPRIVMGIRSFEPGYLIDARRYRNAIDCCVTSGKLIANACTQWAGVDPARVCSIPGGIHPPIDLDARVDNYRNRSGLRDRPLELIYAGRLEQSQKRCLDFLSFLAELKREAIDFRMRFVGTGPVESELRRRLHQDVVDGRVTFHGWVDREELYQSFFPRADLFIHFAAWEGVTIAPREAMAHGVVPIISRFEGLTCEGQFLNEVNSIVFPVGQPLRAVDGVRRLLADPRLYSRLARRATVSQQGDYSFHGSIERWHQTLLKCLRQPKMRGNVTVPPEHHPGRLSKLGIPISLQSQLRKLARRPVQHRSPGSEWPTNSGQMSEREVGDLKAFASTFA
ncbi:glycosyltransferase family 4 protein [Roseiconus lacunae]|uniref:glycosyltransferase family 4 protein n=1 Tax=Roseiconus lacunae TaxID=2605694 RepID=UPI001E5F603C|nr:glycosyltransferase family 4 protein [Roseiconus lacunae]MCD0463010.1 glycosyltransferase family 4 protein [Roseiconus lacunae]